MTEGKSSAAPSNAVGPPSVDASGDGVHKAASGSKSRRGIAMAFGGVALIVISIVAYLWLRPQSTSDSARHAAAEPTLNLDTFVVNLEGGNQRAYLRVGITLGLSRSLNRKDDLPVAALRDTVVTVLSSAHPDQLLSSDGKLKVKDHLLQALQERAPELGIENVYFTEFLVQI